MLVPTLRSRKELNSLFDHFFVDLQRPDLRMIKGQRPFELNIDVKDSEDRLTILAEIPGIKEEDIEVRLDGDLLVIEGEKKSEISEKDEEKSTWYLERTFGKFHRAIPLPTEIEADQVAARFSNGVLTIDLPKSAKAKAKHRKIPIQ